MNNEKIQLLTKFITIKIGGQYFGIPVEHIVDILLPQKIYPTPLARKEIIGSINLRGRIVTALDMKILLDIPPSDAKGIGMCVVLEYDNELFSFQVDEVGSVNNFLLDSLIKTPDNLSKLWQDISFGIFQIKEDLVIILDIEKTIGSIIKTD